MGTCRLFAVVVLLVSPLGCGSSAPPDAPVVASRAGTGTTAKSKAQPAPAEERSALVASAASVPSAAVPPTITETVTATQTATGTSTATATQTYTATKTATGTVPGTATKVVTNTITNTVTQTLTSTTTGTGTRTTTLTGTQTQTVTGSKVLTATGTVTLTYTGTKTGTQTSKGTVSGTKTVSATSTWTNTYIGRGTPSGTKTVTGILTGTATVTGRLTLTATGSNTKTGSTTATASTTASGSAVITQTFTSTSTATGTISSTSTRTATAITTATATGSSTQTTTKTATSTLTQTDTKVKTVTATNTVTTTATVTATATITNPCAGSWAFCDNFETGNGAGWNVRQGPVQDFSVVADGSKVYHQGNSAASQLYVSQAGNSWMDLTVEASLKAQSFSSPAAAVSLWGRYDATWGADCGYYVSLRGDGKVALGKRLMGSDSTLGEPVPVSGGIATGTWYDVKLEIVDTTISAYVNGTLLLSQTDTACDGGAIGVGSLGASFEADDVRVTAPSTNACLQGWDSNTCGTFCTGQTQSDRVGCKDVLKCYRDHGCGPSTCGGQDDICGVNVLNPWGTASKIVADQVYKCLGCRGSVRCDSPKKYDGTMCADGDACTQTDTCQNGVCVGSNPATCYATDQCHDVGTCNSTSGACSNPTKPDGVSCDDGNLCTQSDTCTAGACAGANSVVCTASDQCHTVGTCTPATGTCTDPALPDGTACNDANACTQADTCQVGICSGGNPVICSVPPDQCHSVGSCDSSTGTCSEPTPVDKVGCDVNLRFDGVVDMQDGTFVALLGYNSTATSNVQPTSNQVYLNDELVANQLPPATLAPGNHPGSFLPTFTAGQWITWKVDGQTETTNNIPPSLIPTPYGTGLGVEVDGIIIMLKPDLSPK